MVKRKPQRGDRMHGESLAVLNNTFTKDEQLVLDFIAKHQPCGLAEVANGLRDKLTPEAVNRITGELLVYKKKIEADWHHRFSLSGSAIGYAGNGD